MDNYELSPLPPGSVQAILGPMPPRTFAFIALASILGFASPLSAKEKKASSKKPVRTWSAVVDYVFKNGEEWPIKAPSSRTLGYDADEVPAKGLSIDDDKSTDGQEHSICIVYKIDEKGNKKPTGIDIGTMRVKEINSGKEIDGYQIRMSLDGKPISAMHATGIVGHVKQQALTADAKEVKALFAAERDLYLKNIELTQLLP